MAVPLEQEVMSLIGLGSHYTYFNGSGSCRYIARNAVDKLAGAMESKSLSISSSWKRHCKKALEVDQFDGNGYSLTNTWISCSYAIQDGIYRKESGEGFKPEENWHFFSVKKHKQWEERENYRVYMDDWTLRFSEEE